MTTWVIPCNVRFFNIQSYIDNKDELIEYIKTKDID